MTTPVTTLAGLVELAHQQYGIRFQLKQQQLVNFVNMIQFIAFNKDLDAFLNYDQILFLGQDVFLQTGSSYATPGDDDIGKEVSGSVSGVIGTLTNFQTQNRINKWIIEPPDGGTNISGIEGETLTIVGGSSASGVVVTGQSFEVSKGPYRMPKVADGFPPFRKFKGITQLTDEQRFNLPPSSSFNGYDDYGVLLNGIPQSRHQNYPFSYDVEKKEVTLKTSTAPTIDQTEENYGEGGTTLNTSKLRWIYYINCPSITDISQESNLILPEEYRYEIIFTGISRLADVATYGDMGGINEIIRPLCERFWEDTAQQTQAYGDTSDWISQGNYWESQYMGYSLGRRRITG